MTRKYAIGYFDDIKYKGDGFSQNLKKNMIYAFWEGAGEADINKPHR